ncbi:MAG TPA: FHA domain-containing protein [Anaerolineales bacterium]|jgi:pSer/pThr/pTyr-binding forkhead associated (FHA) protein|nr:FHA domain-containing protein [Anaerolineales bacterium]HQX16094.1 FHA domain-containing protein [Anaerolineales bacterium]
MAQYQLIMRTGPTPGAVFALEGDQLTIGRDSTNEITINDAEVSRRHARLTFQGGKFVLEDLGSTNGTFVNGQRLAGPRVLKAGEVVSFGEQIVLVFESSTFDPAATVASPRAAAVPSASRPVTPPPPPAQYAGSVPASPVMEPASAKKTNITPIIIGVGALLLICVCGGILWYIDANFLWCTFLPFLGGC